MTNKTPIPLGIDFSSRANNNEEEEEESKKNQRISLTVSLLTV
jgi:hypothetical protein